MSYCKRPNCAGTIEDGYCVDCGLAPIGAASNLVAVAHIPPQSATVPTASSSAPISRSASVGTTSRSHGTRGSSARALGAGFVSLPPLPMVDPTLSILANPVVPEHRRFCGSCQKKVTRESGFCPHCGKSYAFEPTLKAGDVVGGQYEVRGPIAFGGLGWIYLAQDTRLTQRWVVLKGLLNSKDENAAQAALQEREFLSAVKHPNIVSVYNFVNHGADGFIVMEYVGGKTLNDLRKERGPLSPEAAIAYIHRLLGAFAYLHERGLVYCDFEPANAMLEDDVKLIDLGGVRKLSELKGEIYGTKGFFAPEIGDGDGPSVVSDLYTVGRSLAVLLLNFDFQKEHLYTLPSAQEEPLFQKHDSLHRFLNRALHKKANRRFQCAEEMSEQLLGVLRDVVSLKATPRLVESEIFGPDPLDPHCDVEVIRTSQLVDVPALKLDADDPASNAILSCGLTDQNKRVAFLERVAAQFSESLEARLRLAEAYFLSGKFDLAELQLKQVIGSGNHDWRVYWYRGQSLMRQSQHAEAFKEFERVYNQLPGELAAKLAFAISAERANAAQHACLAYDAVSRCDASFVTASFGLARCCLLSGDRRGALAAYERVPPTSSFVQMAKIAAVHVLLDDTVSLGGEAELLKAEEILFDLQLDGFKLHDLRARLLLQAISRLEQKTLKPNSNVQLLNEPLVLDRLRFAVEKELRLCAHFATTRELKILFIDRANEQRPRTLV